MTDKAYDAEQRVRQLLVENSCEAVIPSKANRRSLPSCDKELYQARHLIENFFAKLKQYIDGCAAKFPKKWFILGG